MYQKKFLFIIFMMVLPVLAFSQIQQGVIHYEVTTDIHRSLPEDRQELKAMIPQYNTQNYLLYFNPLKSLYQEKPQEDLAPRRGMRMMMGSAKTEIYVNRPTNERTTFQELMGRNYLIMDTLEIIPWKFGSEQLEVADYVCMMAWYTDTVANQEITAWFAPQLPPFMGPDRFTTLPGTVLAVDINNGEKVWVARDIQAREVNEEELIKPSRGEPITRAQFNELIQEQRERMNQRGGRRF